MSAPICNVCNKNAPAVLRMRQVGEVIDEAAWHAAFGKDGKAESPLVQRSELLVCVSCAARMLAFGTRTGASGSGDAGEYASRLIGEPEDPS